MATPIDPTSAGFLLAENRNMPMHVGGLQLFEKPEGAGRNYTREMFEAMRDVEEIAAAVPQAPLPLASAPAASWSGRRTTSSTSSTTSGTAPCPSPAGCASCSSSAAGCTAPAWPGSGRCGRPTSSRGCATAGSRMYSKLHHALVDGVSAMRLLQSVLTTDPDKRDMPAPWGAAAGSSRKQARAGPQPLRGPDDRAAQRARHHRRGGRHARRRWSRRSPRALRNETSALSLYAPRTLFNQKITGSRRFAAQDWPIERLRAHRQGHRHHAERRRARDVQRRGPHLPARARRAPRGTARRDGARSASTPSSRTSPPPRAATPSAR